MCLNQVSRGQGTGGKKQESSQVTQEHSGHTGALRTHRNTQDMHAGCFLDHRKVTFEVPSNPSHFVNL